MCTSSNPFSINNCNTFQQASLGWCCKLRIKKSDFVQNGTQRSNLITWVETLAQYNSSGQWKDLWCSCYNRVKIRQKTIKNQQSLKLWYEKWGFFCEQTTFKIPESDKLSGGCHVFPKNTIYYLSDIFYCMGQVLDLLLFDKHEYTNGIFRSLILVSIFNLWVYLTL